MKYQQFYSPLEAARCAAALNDQWDSETGDIWNTQEMMGVFQCAEEEGEPLDRDNPDVWYAVDELGSVGMTFDNGRTVEWIALGWEPEEPVCPKCGKAVARGAKFCRSCGAKIEAVSAPQAAQASAAPQPAAQAAVCPKCGKPVTPGAKFCRTCGAKLEAVPRRQPAPARPGIVPPRPQPVPPPVSPRPVPQEAACPKCGKPITPGAKFCRSCGAKLDAVPREQAAPARPGTVPPRPQPVPPPEPQRPAAPEVCPKCGSPVRPGVKFCQACGTKLAQQENAVPAAAQLAKQAAQYLAKAVEMAAPAEPGETTADMDEIQQAAIAAAVKAMRGGS